MKKLLLLITLFTLYTHHLQSQWVQQTVPVSKPITGIKFLNTQTGWACTSYGTQQDTGYVLHTTNGGVNWNVQFKKYASSFECLNMVNATTGYIGGYNFDTGSVPLIMKTTNAGANWFNLYANVSSGVTDLFFVNPDSGYSCSQSFINLYTTTNGGLNWSLRTNGINTNVYRLFFLNYNTGYCGASSNLFKTTNAGVNWFQSSSFSGSVRSIYFLNNNTGWLGLSPVGMFARVAFTVNGGANWTIQNVGTFTLNVDDIFFINNQTGWAGIDFPIVYKTTNSGINWGYQVDSSGSHRMSFIDSMNGWSGDTPGRNIISRTTNGGGPIIFTGFISNSSTIPNRFTLHQNYPNPFNPVTTIRIDVANASYVKLIILDILGRELHREQQYLRTGSYEFKWNAAEYSSGTYFYQLITDKYIETKKMLMIK
jgi:photosystem II stability/assembly factor-like uncharacterized protein